MARFPSRPTILVASSNPGKVREIAPALAAVGFEVVGLEALPEPDRAEIPETGATFTANARLKAEGFSRRTYMPVLADDSGLEVDALGGAPGVHSARYGGPGLEDPGRTARLLESLRGVPSGRRTARFRCVLALARAGRTLGIFEGTVEGTIATAARGDNGFGYDPVFLPEGHDRTFGEMSPAEKQALSHRGRAVGAFTRILRARRLAADLN